MKTLLPILVGTFLPLAGLHAAPGKTIGGFEPKTTFTLVVTEKESVRIKNGKEKNVKVPEDVPDYKIGENVKFKISKSGALRVAHVSMKFREESGNTNYYADIPDSNETEPNQAVLKKNVKGEAKKVTVTLYKYTLDGLTPVINKVTYVIRK